MKILNLFILIALCSSCTIHSGLVTSTIPPSQSNSKFEYIDKAVGYSKVSYFLGMGGFGKDIIVEEAKRNMMVCNPLKPNQSYQNQTLHFKKSFFGPYFKLEAIIVADIVQSDSSHFISYSERYLNLLNKNLLKTYNYFNLGEDVLYFDKSYPVKEGKIIGLDSKGATIFFTQKDGTYKIQKTKYERIFKLSDLKELMNKVQLPEKEIYTFNSEIINGNTYTGKGALVGLNNKYALLKLKNTIYIAQILNLIKNNP